MENRYAVTVSERVTYDETSLYHITLSDEEMTDIETSLKEKILDGECDYFDDSSLNTSTYISSDKLTIKDYKKIN